MYRSSYRYGVLISMKRWNDFPFVRIIYSHVKQLIIGKYLKDKRCGIIKIVNINIYYILHILLVFKPRVVCKRQVPPSSIDCYKCINATVTGSKQHRTTVNITIYNIRFIVYRLLSWPEHACLRRNNV